jgi:hypothetical protein
MIILYDNDGFIWCTMSDESTVCDSIFNHKTVDYVFDKEVVDSISGLPNYRIIDEEINLIQNPQEYQLNESLWQIFTQKIYDDTLHLVKTTSKEDLKVLYNQSDAFMKTVIFDCINLKWAEKVPQYQYDLGSEMMIRCLSEYVYIKEVENRDLTTSERSALTSILTSIHQKGAFVQLPPLASGSWYIKYISQLLDSSDLARQMCIPERMYVTGK